MGEKQTPSMAADVAAAPKLADAEVQPWARPLDDILDRLPTDPGVYLMKDKRGKVIYVGKAANLRARVRQYFQKGTGDDRLFVPLLGGLVGDIETVVTGNEKEALLLENTLIKRHQPRFNVKLTDDKNYLVLRLDPQAAWPRLEVVRKLGDDRAWYFGPYHSATACREALRVVNRHFQLRTCTDHVLANRRRPCLQYQIKRCPAPCVHPVSRERYGEQVRDVRLFLEGKSEELLTSLTGRMKEAAGATEFERAAELRDQVQALRTSLEAQRVVAQRFLDQDVIGYHRDGLALEIAVLTVRGGKLVGSRSYSFGGQEFPDAELLSSFVGLYYDGGPVPPDELLLPFPIEDAALKAEWLSEKRREAGRRAVQVLAPQRGPRRALVELADKNARSSYVTRRDARGDAEEMLARLQRRLRLPRTPRTIECYDISHISGFAPVASMVVFVDGKPERARYRTFNVQRAGNDDFAALYEILARRLRRAREGDAGWELPDLIVIDGGKGQLNVAQAAARDVGIDVRPGLGLPMIGLAKERTEEAPAPPPGDPAEATAKPRRKTRRSKGVPLPDSAPDRVFLPHAKDAIPIRPSSAEMFVLAHLRDEAHRFAINFHRLQRRRRTLRSTLSDVPGIGETRQRLLLRQFGSLKKLAEATVDDMAALPGMTRAAAEAVRQHLGAAAPPVAAAPAEPGAVAEDDALDSAFAEVDADDPADDADPTP